MNAYNERSIGQILSEGVRDVLRIGTELLQAMLRLPVPALLLTCLLLAIFLTILPLTLTLFVIFLMIKLIGALISPKQGHQHSDDA